MERANIAALDGSQDTLPLKDILLESSLINITRIFEDSVFFGPVLILSLEEVIVCFFFTFSVQDIIFEVTTKNNVSCYVETLSVASAELDVALVVVAVGVDKSTVPIRQSGSERPFVVASRRIIVSAIPLRLAVVPLAFVDYTCSIEPEVFVWFFDSSLTSQPTIALLLDRV